MQWLLHHGDLLDVPADVLVCSANVYLTLSGGVGGAFLLRYGNAMQDALREYLASRDLRHVSRGDVVVMAPCGSPYKTVLHAVAVDGVYETTPAIVSSVLAKCLEEAARLNARSVALAALATGYGRMTMADFAQSLTPLIEAEYPPVERVVIGLRSRDDVEQLSQRVPRLRLASVQ